MNKVELQHWEYWQINDEQGGLHWGHDQDWYPTYRQRKIGCGPTTVANLLLYLAKSQEARVGRATDTHQHEAMEMMNSVWQHAALCNYKDELVGSLMQRVWQSVTPRSNGISTVRLLRRGLQNYIDTWGYSIKVETLAISAARARRPPRSVVGRFLRDNLSQERPVAWLNRHNGGEKQLESWHWVTVAGLQYSDNWAQMSVKILDNGNILEVDLDRWWERTTRGGGLVGVNFF
jgi:hypothetical protein